MNQKEAPNLYRILSFLGIVSAASTLSAILCIRGQLYTDEWLCIIFLNLMFLAVFVYELEYERREGELYFNTQTNFARISITFGICAVLTAVMAFLPESFRPVMLVSVLMCGTSNPLLAVTAGLFFDILLGICAGGDFYMLACLVLLTLLGTLLSRGLTKPGYRIWIAALLFMISILVPVVFYELAYKQMNLYVYLGGAASGLLTAVASWFYYPSLLHDSEGEVENRYFDIVSEDFSEVKALKDFSEKEYRHAGLVADLAYRCAKKMEYDAGLCLAAGFYYRLGIWTGEPYVENGVSRAEKLCFPGNLITILSEYYGQEKLPSTPESALVHMADVLVTKLENKSRQGETGSDLEFLVYQTLNDLSSTGIYDRSGMSMNQFLRVRELLAKEEKRK